MTNRQAELFIDCRNHLGEGPIWHHLRNELFWFDINEHRLHNANAAGEVLNVWQFDEPVTAAGIVDADSLLIATASKLVHFFPDTDMRETLMPLEAENTDTRSNDGRVDRHGGFWIGTMSQSGDSKGGAVYRYRRGDVEQLFAGIHIPNATCFAPDGHTAYWADTPTGMLYRCTLDAETGRPAGAWEVLIEARGQRGLPDGAVTDSQGYIWSARWGGGCVVRYAPDGEIDTVVDVPVSNVTCPAFGGGDLKTLYITTAQEGLGADELAAQPHAGSVFSTRVDVPGLPEMPVRL